MTTCCSICCRAASTRETAQRLLKWAFLGDVVAKIELPGLRRQIEERLVGQLQDDALRELL